MPDIEENCNLTFPSGVPLETSTIEKCLDQEWEDQRHVRSQSWKTIEMSLTIIAGSLGAKFVLKHDDNNLAIAVIGGFLLTLSSTLGFWICICHSVREWWIMRIITELERFLHYKYSQCVKCEFKTTNQCYCPYNTKCERATKKSETLLDIISIGDLNINTSISCNKERNISEIKSKVFGVIRLFWNNCFKLSRVSSLLVIYHLVLIGLAQATIVLAFPFKIFNFLMSSLPQEDMILLEYYNHIKPYKFVFYIDGVILLMILSVLLCGVYIIILKKTLCFLWDVIVFFIQFIWYIFMGVSSMNKRAFFR